MHVKQIPISFYLKQSDNFIKNYCISYYVIILMLNCKYTEVKSNTFLEFLLYITLNP